MPECENWQRLLIEATRPLYLYTKLTADGILFPEKITCMEEKHSLGNYPKNLCSLLTCNKIWKDKTDSFATQKEKEQFAKDVKEFLYEIPGILCTMYGDHRFATNGQTQRIINFMTDPFISILQGNGLKIEASEDLEDVLFKTLLESFYELEKSGSMENKGFINHMKTKEIKMTEEQMIQDIINNVNSPLIKTGLVVPKNSKWKTGTSISYGIGTFPIVFTNSVIYKRQMDEIIGKVNLQIESSMAELLYLNYEQTNYKEILETIERNGAKEAVILIHKKACNMDDYCNLPNVSVIKYDYTDCGVYYLTQSKLSLPLAMYEVRVYKNKETNDYSIGLELCSASFGTKNNEEPWEKLIVNIIDNFKKTTRDFDFNGNELIEKGLKGIKNDLDDFIDHQIVIKEIKNLKEKDIEFFLQRIRESFVKNAKTAAWLYNEDFSSILNSFIKKLRIEIGTIQQKNYYIKKPYYDFMNGKHHSEKDAIRAAVQVIKDKVADMCPAIQKNDKFETGKVDIRELGKLVFSHLDKTNGVDGFARQAKIFIGLFSLLALKKDPSEVMYDVFTMNDGEVIYLSMYEIKEENIK